jgi:protein SCO1/2
MKTLSSGPRSLRYGVGVLFVACLTLLAGCGNKNKAADTDTGVRGIQIDPPTQVGDLSLPRSDNGAAFPLKAAPGKLLLTYFGYTNCPDVCPTTLADVKGALKELGTDGQRVDVAMITVDPERDTDPNFTSYVQTFVPKAAALRTTDPAALKAVADRFLVSYSVTKTADGKVEVVHSGLLFAVDDQGKIVLRWNFPTPTADLVHDMRILLKGIPAA